MRAMARPPSAAKELHATWARLGIDASAIDPEPDGTLRPAEALAPASAPTVASDAIQVPRRLHTVLTAQTSWTEHLRKTILT